MDCVKREIHCRTGQRGNYKYQCCLHRSQLHLRRKALKLTVTQKSTWKLDCNWAAFSSRFFFQTSKDWNALFAHSKQNICRLFIYRELRLKFKFILPWFLALIFQLASSFTAFWTTIINSFLPRTRTCEERHRLLRRLNFCSWRSHSLVVL